MFPTCSLIFPRFSPSCSGGNRRHRRPRHLTPILRRILSAPTPQQWFLRRLRLTTARLHLEPGDKPRFRRNLPLHPRLLILPLHRGDEPRLRAHLPSHVDAVGRHQVVGAHGAAAVAWGLCGVFRRGDVGAEVEGGGDDVGAEGDLGGRAFFGGWVVRPTENEKKTKRGSCRGFRRVTRMRT